MSLIVENGTGLATAESWMPIAEFNGLYEVSSFGRVRSLDRLIRRGNGRFLMRGRVLRHGVKPGGYVFVNLCEGGVQACRNVHRLVAEAFLEAVPGKDQVNHLNGRKSDNVVANLEWCTASENLQHAYAFGLRKPAKNGGLFGEDNPACKLSPATVREVREAREMGMTFRTLGQQFGVSAAHAFRLCAGQRQRHVGNAT